MREIARQIGVAASTVRATVKRFQAAGLSWPPPEELTDAALEARLFTEAGTKQGHRRRIEPDWASIHRELKRKHVTLSILWDEYIERNPEGYRFYSVPYRFARNEVEVRLTGRTVEIFAKGKRIAVHMRSSGNGKHTTAVDHMPSSHRRYADWTIGRIRRDAALVGPSIAALCDLILEQRPHPEQGFRSCLGILRLARPFGVARLEAAATRAIEIGALTYGSVRSILDHKLDRHAAHPRAADGAPILHPNIRGSRYYN